MGLDISVPVSEDEKKITLTDAEILKLYGIEDLSLSLAKQKFIVDYLRHSAKSLIHLVSTKSTDTISEAVSKYFESSLEQADDYARGLDDKLRGIQQETNFASLAKRSDLKNMEQRLKKYSIKKIEEVQEQLSQLTIAVNEPWDFKETESENEDDNEESEKDVDGKIKDKEELKAKADKKTDSYSEEETTSLRIKEKTEKKEQSSKDDTNSESSTDSSDAEKFSDEDSSSSIHSTDSSSDVKPTSKKKKGKNGTFFLPSPLPNIQLVKNTARWNSASPATIPINPLIKSGIWKCKVKLENTSCCTFITGICLMKYPLTYSLTVVPGDDNQIAIFETLGKLRLNGKNLQSLPITPDNTSISTIVDMKKKRAYFYANGVLSPAYLDKLPKELYIGVRGYASNGIQTVKTMKKISKVGINSKKLKEKISWC
ncbi:uncharacterized protein MONOS_11880 [Monocercomonoides exilis]|uniref:uncharacterized protein n=1 Tax=Monocercomonoides exilis TaxID=2049356 RepID=UPI0035597B4B|nr:hypothetical protein MONOS_11880 [Monocercomonoides exilis]|eukprot:MONOS_11880.1-p1 / transcript=MONOS_11880.1 / gene=MONOS_11880 / organism=Monocercomonoides_exilis_PA203 / gene_product=unspecified product / transcript_product=unspecified product / location=Mono_scaffold00621:19952-21526(-) / protein_length=428 / sequence_SO=supercontig / SO=protein_coding / is_pseudo=false